ncbi:MAG: helix-turn-helix transcriptional regulator [Clostridia bacterium]|nr:helix-turn-helix transcriptional regulator [Clostridia bacterium]
MEGSVECQVGNEIFHATENEILFANPYDIHACFPAPNNHKECIFILGDSYWQDFLPIFKKSHLPAHLRDKEFNKTLLDIILPSFKNGYNFYIEKGYANLILGNLIHHYPLLPIKPQSNLQTIQLILEYIETHYRENLSLEKIARVVGYNKFHFSNLFNSYIGVNLNTYINWVRVRAVLQEAKESPSSSLLQIAFNNGFSSEATFYRALKNFQSQ